MFDRYQNMPAVDDSRLKGVLRNLRQLREEVVAVGSQYLQPLRENEFLSAIKHRSAIPGGACEFDLPEYSHWLRRPYADRIADIERWMSTVKPLCNSICELLWLVRESTPPTAAGGRQWRVPPRAEQGRHHRAAAGEPAARHCPVPGNQRQPSPLYHALHAVVGRRSPGRCRLPATCAFSSPSVSGR